MWTKCMIVAVWVCVVRGAPPAAAPVVSAPMAATARPPARTLDRQAAELAWRSWLQSPESGNPNAPPRRITTKSLFITPLVCPKGQRLDRDGCVQVLTVNKDEHERILLEQLNALFTSAPGDDVLYDYGDDEPGPLQLSIPIGLEPQAAPLQAHEPTAQAQEPQLSFIKVDKKGPNTNNNDGSIEAELELLKLPHNHTGSSKVSDKKNMSHNVLNSLIHPFSEKPKRDSSNANSSEVSNADVVKNNDTDTGEKELIFGQINIDPILKNDNEETEATTTFSTTSDEAATTTEFSLLDEITFRDITEKDFIETFTTTEAGETTSVKSEEPKTKLHALSDGEKSQLKPENEYSGIGEAIKLISRYAEVTTDEDFSKESKTSSDKEDSVLGTRTKLQHRRNKLNTDYIDKTSGLHFIPKLAEKDRASISLYPKNSMYYRYPWVTQNSVTPPPDYPFRHVQDYWPGKKPTGVYNSVHENPRRHHHSIPHSYYRNHGMYPGVYQYADKSAHVPRYAGEPMRFSSNADLYTLLGLRHWFSGEAAAKR